MQAKLTTVVMAALLASGGLSLATPRAAHTSARPVALFDEGHGQRFLVEQNGPLDLSRLAEVLENQGFEIKTTTQLLTEPLLAHVDALVISGAFKSLTAAEVEATTRFVERGGRLSVMLHIGPPVADLLHRLHTSISNGVICEQENIIDDTCTNFRITRLKPHDLTKGLQGFSVFGGWALLSTGGTTSMVAETSRRAWIDLNGDGKLGGRDALQAFAVVVTGQVGRGHFVVFGDDAIFQNQFLQDGNLLLAKNLAAWLAQLPA